MAVIKGLKHSFNPSVLIYPSSVFLILFILCLNTHFHFLPISFPSTLLPRQPQDQKIENKAPLVRGRGSLEQGLDRARASIRDAGRRRKYTSYEDGAFVPRGPIYRNPYAFHQSHKEMEKRFKVWVYKEGEPPLFHKSPVKEIYSIEGHIIEELERSNSPFAARDPDHAQAFFLPVGIANVIHYLYSPRLDYDRGRLQRVVTDYVRVVANKYNYWNKSAGADHFFVSCHDWGPDATRASPELFKNLIRGLCNANSSEGFVPSRDFPLPELKILSGPDKFGPPDFNQSPENRSIFAFFAGGSHGHVRKKLLRHWKDKDPEIQVHEYLPKGANYFELMSRSKFCLCPSGYEVASPRLIESMHTGCVPVIISDGYVLPFSDVLVWDRFSVHIPVANISNIKEILKGVVWRGEYLEKYEQLLRVKRHFVLHRPAQPFDLLDMVLHSLWLRRLNIRLSY